MASEAAPHRPLRIGITLGDPRGIGPEVVVAAARELRRDAADPHLLVIGPAGTVADELDCELMSVGSWAAGGGSAEAGRLAGAAVEAAAHLALRHEIDAIVTAPLDKAALHAGGYPFPGHTEMLASLAGTQDVVMMLAAERTVIGGALRVVLATTHMPLRDVPQRLTANTLITQTRLTAAGLRSGWGIAEPRLALCAFNPHASDGGLFGDEEARVYAPALDVLRADGLHVSGPIPADTVFLRAARGEFDGVIAPYHDVGMAAFKTVAFGSGVNVTLGLPFPRTSPDHGTALRLAGRGVADASSMREALSLATKLAAIRRHSSVAAA